ncbi:hypothetical protein [Enterovirga sp. CN4-39]|uniref:hypothetical protein n=1 Tax=Enterovirga sp. CN4-39 TaxID=3400910 RepID=UPI003C01B5AD
MITPFVAVRLVAATVVLGGVALAGSAIAKPLAAETTLAANVAAPVSGPVAAAATMAEPDAACARKVKVVYSGYGEADRIACAVPAKSAAK